MNIKLTETRDLGCIHYVSYRGGGGGGGAEDFRGDLKFLEQKKRGI